jgi:hypothetical protein
VAADQADVPADPRRLAARRAGRAHRPDERGDRPARGALLPRVDRRGPRPREAVQAHLGCDRQRVRRPARALRDELLRQLAGFTAAPWADA